MNHRQRCDLDRHITGNWGEDSVGDPVIVGPDSDPRDFDRNDPPDCACGETLQYEPHRPYVPEGRDPPTPAEPEMPAHWYCGGCGTIWKYGACVGPNSRGAD